MKGSFIAIYKNVGESSFQALTRVKKHFNTRKVGHLGTLDVLAEGVLGVCVDEATKLIPYIDSEPKVYEVEIFFGFHTESYDAEGVDLEKDLLEADKVDFSDTEMITALDEVRLQEMQVPPIYSAIKINGVRAYKLAREGAIEQSEIKAKKVQLLSYEVLSFDLPIVKLRLVTSSGYYVRSLVRDVAEKLGVKAFMYSLKRTAVGNFCAVEGGDFVELPYEKVLKNFIRVDVLESEYLKLQNGLKLPISGSFLGSKNEIVYVFFENSLVSLVKLDFEKNEVSPIKNFVL